VRSEKISAMCWVQCSVQEHCLSKLLANSLTRYSPFAAVFTIRRHHSLLATRYSLPFSAQQEFRPPIFSGYATFENLPKFLTAEGGEGDEP
jgi:hypothetical protein